MQLPSKHWPRIAATLIPLMFALMHASGVLPIGVLQRLDDIIYDARLRATMPFRGHGGVNGGLFRYISAADRIMRLALRSLFLFFRACCWPLLCHCCLRQKPLPPARCSGRFDRAQLLALLKFWPGFAAGKRAGDGDDCICPEHVLGLLCREQVQARFGQLVWHLCAT